MNGDTRPIEELAAEPLDEADARLLGEIAAIYDQAEPVPTGVTARMKFALALTEMEAELAQICDLDVELAGARSDVETVRTISFTASTVTIVVTISDGAGDRVRIDGWLSPAQALLVQLQAVDESRSGTADENGRFVFEEVPPGLARLVVSGDSGARPVATPTFHL